MPTCRVVAVAVLAAGFLACSSSSTPDAGQPNPTVPVTLTISASPPQTQSVQVPQSGPVTGTVSFPPVTTVPANTIGNLTVSFLSGPNVAFVRAAAPEPQSFVRQKNSDATLPAGPYIFEMTVTAPFAFTLASVPAFNLNLGTAGEANAAYVLLVAIGTSAPYEFPTTSQNDVISFPGSAPSLSVAAGTVLTFGIALASNVPSAPTITSFTASPSSLAVDGGTVTLTWTVSGATALSIDNGVGPVTPLTTGTVTPTVAATTPFTLTATNGNGMSVATASICVASGAVTAAITVSPASYTQCTDSFLTSIALTNGSCQVVTVTSIAFASIAGTCNYSGNYTSAIDTNLPFSVDAGATETVFDLTNGEIGCCPTSPPCSVNCTDTLDWTLTTNVGPIGATAPAFTVNVSNCSNLSVCGT